MDLLNKRQLTTLLFTSILGIRPKIKLKINLLIRSIDRYVQELTQIGIKGSVANDRNLSFIHKTFTHIQNLSVSLDLFEIKIKVVDLLTPYKKEGKINLFRGAGIEKTIVIIKLIYNLAIEHSKLSIFSGTRERTREGNNLYRKIKELK